MVGRSSRNNKGWIRLVELVLAAVLVFGYIVFLEQTRVADTQPLAWNRVRLSQATEDTLYLLDAYDEDANGRSDLRDQIYANNWTWLELKFNETLPPTVGYVIYYFNLSTQSTSKVSGAEEFAVVKETIVVWYPITGQYGRGCIQNEEDVCALKVNTWFRQ